METKTVKPVLGGIPLVVETSGTGFTCASPPRLDTPAPGEEEQPMRRRSGGLWRRTTDDGDMLEMEYARKKLGLSPSGKKKGLLSMFTRKKSVSDARAAGAAHASNNMYLPTVH